jgi:hypothetical protein
MTSEEFDREMAELQAVTDQWIEAHHIPRLSAQGALSTLSKLDKYLQVKEYGRRKAVDITRKRNSWWTESRRRHDPTGV